MNEPSRPSIDTLEDVAKALAAAEPRRALEAAYAKNWPGLRVRGPVPESHKPAFWWAKERAPWQRISADIEAEEAEVAARAIEALMDRAIANGCGK